MEYHSLLLTQTIHYITPNHHAVQVSIASGMGINACYTNGSQADSFIPEQTDYQMSFFVQIYEYARKTIHLIGYFGTPPVSLLGGV